MNNKRNERNKEYLRRTNDVSQFEHHTDMNFANLLFSNYIPNKRELIINFKRRCFFFLRRSYHGLRKAVRTTNRSTQLQGRNIARAQLRATVARHRCTIEVRSEDVRERIGQAKLVSRVVYKLAFDRGLEPLSFFLSLSSLPIQSLIVDSR